jgi:hypothetical protein
MNSTASVVAQWAGLCAIATAKVKEIFKLDIDIRMRRFGLLILPVSKWGMVSSCREDGATSFGHRKVQLRSEGTCYFY